MVSIYGTANNMSFLLGVCLFFTSGSSLLYEIRLGSKRRAKSLFIPGLASSSLEDHVLRIRSGDARGEPLNLLREV